WDVDLRAEAMQAVQDVLEIPEGLCDPMYGPEALMIVMRILAAAGDMAGLDRANVIAFNLEDSTFRDQALGAAVRELSRSGDVERAIAVAKQYDAGDIARIADEAFQAGHRELAFELLDQVLQEADTLPVDNGEAIAYSSIAYELAMHGAGSEASSVADVA